MIHQKHLLLPQSDINDLRWFFESAEGDVSGLRSPDMAGIAPARDGLQEDLRRFKASLRCGPIHVGAEDHGAGDRDVDDERMDAVLRERRVRRGLAEMQRIEREVLFRCFAKELLDQREIYGRYGNCAELTVSALQAHRVLRTPRPLVPWLDWLGNKLRHNNNAPTLITVHLNIVTETRELAKRAAKAYSRGEFIASDS